MPQFLLDVFVWDIAPFRQQAGLIATLVDT